MPAVTMRLEMTKQDMRKGRKTGCPVSIMVRLEFSAMSSRIRETYLDAASSPRPSLPAISPASWILLAPAYRTRRASWHSQALMRRRRGFCQYIISSKEPIGLGGLRTTYHTSSW